MLALAHSVFTSPELIRKALLFKHGRVLSSTVSSDKLNANKIVPVSELEHARDHLRQGIPDCFEKDSDYYAKILLETSDDEENQPYDATTVPER